MTKKRWEKLKVQLKREAEEDASTRKWNNGARRKRRISLSEEIQKMFEVKTAAQLMAEAGKYVLEI